MGTNQYGRCKEKWSVFTQRNQLRNGDIVYWDWEGNDDSDHVGIYEKSTGKVIQAGSHTGTKRNLT